MNNKLWLKRIRNYAGLLGALLPWLSLFGAFVVGELPRSFWNNLSISATYYVTPALPAILTAASIVLMCYDGYNRLDNIVTTISGVFGLLIVLFPCNCSIAGEYVGFFQCPVKISSVIHCTSAVIFFCLLSFNSLFLFTKSDGEKTKMKKKRNLVYIACGIGMLISLSLMILPFSFPAKTWVVETLALSFFGFSWLTKGEALEFLNDEE